MQPPLVPDAERLERNERTGTGQQHEGRTGSTAGAYSNRRTITVSIMLATIMQVLDTTIANVALPHMQASLGATQDTDHLGADLLYRRRRHHDAADRLARRPVRPQGAVPGLRRRLHVASMLCGIATSLDEMVLFRLLQGVFGAALVPLSQTVLLDINPREKHGQAMAMWGAGIMVGPIIGPTLGGWLTENYSWRWVFYINLPVGILAFVGHAGVPAGRAEATTARFDFFGFAMLSLGIGALQMMLDRGEQLDWFESLEIWIELGLIISGFWVFIVHIAHDRRSPSSISAMFRDRNFVDGAHLHLHRRHRPALEPGAAAADAAEADGLSGHRPPAWSWRRAASAR